MPEELSAGIVTFVIPEGYGKYLSSSGFSRLSARVCIVVVSIRLPLPVLNLLTFAASHDLNKTVYGRSSECGVCLEIVRESE